MQFPQKEIFILYIISWQWIVSLGNEWNYNEQDNWPELCRGNLQSPIAINSATAIIPNASIPIQFHNYNKEILARIKNSKHAVVVTPDDLLTAPSISGGALEGIYKFANLHFHYDAEHLINNVRYPLEIHLVHYFEKYGNVETALNYEDGIAVLAIFCDFPGEEENPNLDAFVDMVHLIANQIDEPVDFKIVLDYFLPENKSYFWYFGSLTTPNCNQVVVWTLFESTLPLGVLQLHNMTQILTADNAMLPANYRNLQNLNNRSVFYVQSNLS